MPTLRSGSYPLTRKAVSCVPSAPCGETAGFSDCHSALQTEHTLFSDLEGLITSVDDFLYYDRTKKEQDKHLQALLHRCRNVEVKKKPSKLQFCKESVRFMGHVVGAVPEDRVSAIQATPPPKDSERAKKFLGLVNYVSKFIPDLASRSAPLRRLTRHDTDFVWDAAAQQAFDDLKGALRKSPVLAIFDRDRPAVLSVDASSYGLGAVLLQDGRPMAYASASLNPTQQNYAQIEKELLAVVFGCEHFRFYLIGANFEDE